MAPDPARLFLMTAAFLRELRFLSAELCDQELLTAEFAENPQRTQRRTCLNQSFCRYIIIRTKFRSQKLFGSEHSGCLVFVSP